MAIRAYLTSLKQSAVNYITSTLVAGDKVALDVAVVAGNITLGANQVGPDRSFIDMSVDNISDVAWLDLITPTNDIIRLDITNNSGGNYSLRKNGVDEIMYIPAGYVGQIDVNIPTGEIIAVQSLALVINAGTLIINTLRQ